MIWTLTTPKGSKIELPAGSEVVVEIDGITYKISVEVVK